MNKQSLFRRLAVALSICGLLGCGDDGGRGPMIDGAVVRPDEDGDTIANQDEGSAAGVDTDGDGTEDWLDEDSDNDGLPDALEAGDADLGTLPVDSDGDGIPDFQDFDSDNNGILDEREGDGDNDLDGIPDYADEDDDNDGLRDEDELMGRVDFPRDVDDDGIPDFRDNDSDNDFILDGTEGRRDTDGDGIPDLEDLDSDGDGLLDSVEAGDEDLNTVPVDTDGDGAPDYRDADSDEDGLSDAFELEAGTDPLVADTDGDGVGDLIEVGAGTDALDPADNPRANGDFVFVVPFREPPRPARDTLQFRTSVELTDVYFLFDTTGSMSGEIAAMRRATVEIIERLTCEDYGSTCVEASDCEFAAPGATCSSGGRCIEDPELNFCIADLWTGVGTYEGNPDSYTNLRSLQPIPRLTQEAVPASASGGGASEALFESVACTVDETECAAVGCTAGGIGCPSFRPDALRLIVGITDEDNECSSCSPNTATEAGTILQLNQVFFAGVNAGNDRQAQTDLEDLATAADSFTTEGSPLVFEGDADLGEERLIQAVTDAIIQFVQGRLFVTIDAVDEPGDSGDALQFIQRLQTNVTRPGCSILDPLADVNPRDGFTETFPNTPPGSRVCWDLVVRPNVTVPATPAPQLFKATLTVTGDGSTLDRRQVFFLVPPEVPDIGGEF